MADSRPASAEVNTQFGTPDTSAVDALMASLESVPGAVVMRPLLRGKGSGDERSR
jgi:hypothetical protein